MPRGVLYLVGCAAEPVVKIKTGIYHAQQARWNTCLILTPSARRWLADDISAMEQQTGHPVRSEYKMYGEADVLPKPDAILVLPATFNTINKWAAGVADTLPLGLLTEALGLGLPIVAVPCLNDAQSKHPAFDRSVALLRDAGVTVMLGGEGYELGEYLWELSVDEVGRQVAKRQPPDAP